MPLTPHAHSFVLALCTTAFVTASASAQRQVPLGSPVATVAEPFSRLAQTVELRDGRVLVHDDIENKVQMVDSAFRSFRPFIQSGAGPGELGVVTRILPLADGTALVSDRSGVRFVRVDPAQRVATDWAWEQREVCAAGSAASISVIRFADQAGRLHTEARGIAKSPSGEPVISHFTAVERFSTPCVRDTVAVVPVEHPERLMVMSGGIVVTRPEFADGTHKPFLTTNQWTLASNGSVFVVASAPFRVHVFVNGQERAAATIKYEPVPVSDAIKEAWREKQRAPQRVISRVRGGTSSVSMQRVPFVEPTSWPRVLPPFPREALVPAADGTVWLRRSTPHNANANYDVIGSDAKVVMTISLTSNRRVVGISKRFVYVARTDDDGLEWLERSLMPDTRVGNEQAMRWHHVKQSGLRHLHREPWPIWNSSR